MAIEGNGNNAAGFLVLLVDWEEGEVTPIASPMTEQDAIETAEEFVGAYSVAYVIPVHAYRKMKSESVPE